MTRWTEADIDAFHKRQGRAKEKLKPLPKPRERSELEVILEAQIKADGLPEPETEVRWHKTRRWRMDFAWTPRKIGVEVQGMVHRIRERFMADIEKRAELVLSGWKVLEVDGASIRDGRAIAWIRRLLA